MINDNLMLIAINIVDFYGHGSVLRKTTSNACRRLNIATCSLDAGKFIEQYKLHWQTTIVNKIVLIIIMFLLCRQPFKKFNATYGKGILFFSMLTRKR